MAIIYNNKLCIEASELIRRNDKTGIGSDKGFLAEGTYYSRVNRGLIIVARRSNGKQSALVEYDTMDERTKQQYNAIYGDPHDVPEVRDETNAVIMELEANEAALTYFMNFKTADGLSIKREKAYVYALQARILDACLRIAHRKKNEIGAGSTRFNVWDALSNLVNDMATIRTSKGEQKYPHALPSTGKTLKRKADRYKKEGLVSLINQNLGNRAASIVKTAESEALLHKIFSQHMNLDNVQAMNMYNQIAPYMGLREIKSPATIDAYKKKMEATTLAHRRGSSVFKNKLEMQIKRTPPKTAMTYWTLDGWTVELLYQKKELKPRKVNGVTKEYNLTTYTNRMTIVVVLDACCKYPIGYAIGLHESPALIREALRNAIKHTVELFGSRYKPIQLQSDNYQRGQMLPFYEAVCKYYTNAALGNAKSKIIEPYFKYLNSTYCQMLPNWSGYGVTSRKELQPNVEILNRNRKCIPDAEGVLAQIESLMSQERELKRDAYLKAWEATPDDRRLPFSDEEYLMLMGETSGYSNRLTGQGLRLEFNGQRLFFESFDLELRNHYNEDWLVRYDPDDMSRVLISNCTSTKGHRVDKEIGSLRFMMEAETKIPMALVDQTEEHHEHRAKVARYNEALRKQYVDKQNEVDEVLRSVTQRIPSLPHDDILERALIVDSWGQHKDRRTESREATDDYEYAEIIDDEALRPAPAPFTDDDDEDYEWSPTDMNFSR